MSDSLIDDVKKLLEEKKGDERILKQILRACENNEIISNYERNYVRKLSEKRLDKIPLEKSETPTAPDVVIPKTIPIQSHTFEVKPANPKSNNSKILLGVGIISVIIIIAAISLADFSNGPQQKTETTNQTLKKFSINTDVSSYNRKDIIVISGSSDTTGIINLSIKNKDKELVWAEQILVKGAKFSTLVIAGGPGWESSGTFTVEANNGAEIKSNTFSFNASVESVSTQENIEKTPDAPQNIEPKTTVDDFKEASVSTSSGT